MAEKLGNGEIQPIKELLVKKEFVSVATSDLKCQPNAAPKMILDLDNEFIYLVDHTAGKTWDNLKVNPRISISFSDAEELTGYKINGTVDILEGVAILQDLKEKLDEKQTFLSVERVMRGVRTNKRHSAFELGVAGKIVVYKVKCDEIIEIGPQGDLKRKQIGKV